MLFSGTVEADGNGSHGVMGTETWRMDQVGPGQIRVLQHQSELEPLETTAEHTPAFQIQISGAEHILNTLPVTVTPDPLGDPLPSTASGSTGDIRSRVTVSQYTTEFHAV